MTKADKIRKLNNGKRSTGVIGRMVGCRPEYVRVVLRQRIVGGPDYDTRYKVKKFGSVAAYNAQLFQKRYWGNPAFREKRLAEKRAWTVRKAQERAGA